MINFSLLIVPESAISPKSLWEESLPTLIELLGDWGYSIVSDDTVEAVGVHRLLSAGTRPSHADRRLHQV